MTAKSAAEIAAADVRTKAVLLAKSSKGSKGQRQAAALDKIADLVARGVVALRAGLSDVSRDPDIDSSDVKRAAEIVYSAAVRREGQGTQARLDAPKKSGWEVGALGQQFHRPTLACAIELYEMAFALNPHGAIACARGRLLERVGDLQAAIEVFENLPKTHAKDGKRDAARCRRMLSVETGEPGSTDLKSGSAIEASAVEGGEDPSEKLELVAQTAQEFADCLVGRDFASARRMLSRRLPLTGADLRDAYNEMVGSHAGDSDIQVTVVSSETDMPDMESSDLGWVFVSISGADLNEGITVLVTNEKGSPKIRELEWGGPN